MQQTNHNFNFGGHAPLPPASQGGHSSAPNPPNGEKKATPARRRLSAPVTSGDGSHEPDTREHGLQIFFGRTDVGISTPPRKPMIMVQQQPTVYDLSRDVQRSIRSCLSPGGPEIAECFKRATEQPPITPESLTELDMPRIINNAKLRHDVNFDRELHFRPNFDGSKGKEKAKLVDDYWKALEGELFMYGFVIERRMDPVLSQNEAYWKGILDVCGKRLPKVFDSIREILKTLVPDYDQQAVVERLDVGLLMQEIENGVCDLVNLADWLAKILKNHCAPMRDNMVDRMRVEITLGAVEQKPSTLVNGIRQLLSILETMKLDVANHQIRHMRPLLIEDTVNFLRRYNACRISANKIDVKRSKLWLEYEMSQLTTEVTTPSHLEALTSALLRSLVFQERTPQFPQTFCLDLERLQVLRMELHARIYQELCRDVLMEMMPAGVPSTEITNACAALRMTVSAIVGPSARFPDRVENIAVEIMRILLMLEGRDPPFCSTLLDFVETRLHWDFMQTASVFEKHAQEIFDKILPKLQASVARDVKFSALHLQSKLVPPLPLPPPPAPFGFGAVCTPPAPGLTHMDPDEDVVRRLTHIIVLHWQVWVDLVYLAVPEDDHSTPGSGECHTAPSSASTSPTVPVAKAVYAPGRKWLPIGITVTEIPSGLPTPEPSPLPQIQSPAMDDDPNDPSSEQSPVDAEQQQPA